MAIGQLGSTQAFVATGNSTTAKTGTISVESGSRRYMLVFVSRGYVNDANSIFPTSITVGGQTVNAITTEAESGGGGGNNSGSIVYGANEATIAAMSGGAFTITYDVTLATSYEISVSVVFLGDVDQTAGVVDSDQVGTTGSPKSRTLTTTSGDLCFGFGDQRGDQTANSLGTGMTAFDTLAPSSASLSKSSQRIDTITASGASTTVQMVMGSSEIGALHAVAFTEDTGGGGGGGVTSDQTRATLRGAHRGIMRGAI